MTEGELEQLKAIGGFPETGPYRVLFTDGEEYLLTIGWWFQDGGEPAKYNATVVDTVSSTRKWKTGAAIVFDLADVVKITEPSSNTSIFKIH